MLDAGALTLDSFEELFPELECSVESDVALQFWGEEALDLLNALGCAIDARNLYLATAHVVALKSQTNGPIASVKHVNSTITYESQKVRNDGTALRWTPYGKLIADKLEFGADFGDGHVCWSTV